MIRHIVWDWNGTLFDDAPLSWAVTARMLEERGRPGLTLERYVSLMGHPYEEAYRRAGFDYSAESYADLARIWVEGYALGWKERPLRAGVAELLRDLSARGVTHSILTASREDLAREQLAYFGLIDRFLLIEGVRDDLAEGKDHLARRHREQLGIAAEAMLFVGDTDHDVLTAKAMGCRCVLLCGGHMDETRLRAAGAPVLPDVKALRTYLGE